MKKPWNRNHICTWFSLWPYKLKRLLCERSEDAEIIKQTGHEPMTTLRNGNITYTSKLPNYKENLQSGCYCRLHCTISNAENTIGRIIGFAFIFRFIANQQLSNILQGIKKKKLVIADTKAKITEYFYWKSIYLIGSHIIGVSTGFADSDRSCPINILSKLRRHKIKVMMA